MQIEIYADVVFAINVVMDFFIFWIVNKLIMKKSHIGRLVLGAVVASLFYCIFVFISAINIFSTVLLFVGSVYIAFKPQNLKECLKLIALTNIVAFAVGGVGMGLFYYTNLGGYVGNNIEVAIYEFPIKILLSSICFCYITIKLCMSWYKRVIFKKQTFCEVELYIGDKHINIKGLVDTGNSLQEPITKKPVMVAELTAVKKILPSTVYSAYSLGENVSDIIKNIADDELINNIKIIPFSSLGQKNGVIIGITMDRAVIKDKVILKPIVALYSSSLSIDGFYNALLSPEFIGEGQANV